MNKVQLNWFKRNRDMASSQTDETGGIRTFLGIYRS